jgi:hypothetical protein
MFTTCDASDKRMWIRGQHDSDDITRHIEVSAEYRKRCFALVPTSKGHTMTGQQSRQESEKQKFHFGCLHVIGLIALVIVLTTLFTAWWVKHNIYASPLAPTRLNTKEQQVFEAKMAKLEDAALQAPPAITPTPDPDTPLQPEPYNEDDASREIRLTEKELNAMLAEDPEQATRVAIDLADDLISLTMLVPLDEDFPLIGGTTLRIRAGATLRYEDSKPVVAIRGVSIGGIPLPGAWWGDIKNKNLVEEFSGTGGFWDQFAKGIENVQVREGHLLLQLKE